MKILYYCHNCGDFIDELSVEKLDEERLGFNILTEEEKKDIMKWSKSGDMLYVGSVCDNCYQDLSNTVGKEMEPYHNPEEYDATHAYDGPRLH